MSIIIWFLATAGSALVLTQSTITERFRNWLSSASQQAAATRDLRIAYESQRRRDPAMFPAIRRIPMTRAWSYVLPWFAKLVSCPMCSGFWFGLGWAAALGTRGVALAAHALGGSVVSALAVAAWIALIEAQQALALWRYNNSKDPPPEGVCEERMQLTLRSGACSNPLDIACPRHGVWKRGEKCPGR